MGSRLEYSYLNKYITPRITPQITPLTLTTAPSGRTDLHPGGGTPKGKNLPETYFTPQINLKRKFNAWISTLLANIHGRKNPIISASKPYTNNKNSCQTSTAISLTTIIKEPPLDPVPP